MIEHTENPASNPTRRWRDDDSTADEIALLISNIDTGQHRLLLRLSEYVSFESDDPDRDAPIAAWLNRFAEAYGFVPLIHVNEKVFSLAEGAQQPLRRALARSSQPSRP